MNILLVTPYFPPQTGGVVTFVEALQRLLRENGHAVYVIVPGQSHTIATDKNSANSYAYEMYLRVPWVPESPLRGLIAFLVYLFPTLFQLKRFLHEKAIDIISLEYPLPYMYYFSLLGRLLGVKLVVGIHGSDVLSLHEAPRHEQWLVKNMMRAADHVLAHSSSLLLQAERIIGRLRRGRSFIHYGIEPDRLLGVVKERRGNFPVPQKPYILTVAKLHKRKGLDILLQAIKRIEAVRDGYSFVIVGSGPEDRALEQLAGQLGIQSTVIFTGELQAPDIVALYKECEFFVLPSRSEPFGIVFLEAMMFGKAIVATKVGGIPEFVVDGRNGLLVPPDDSDALAEAIISLIRKPELRFSFSSQSLLLVKQHYDFRKIIHRHEQLFLQLLAQGDPKKSPRTVSRISVS